MSSITDMQDPEGDADWFERTRIERDRRHGIARRHSRRVRFLKYALPVVSLVAVVGFFVYLYVLPSLPPGISASSIDINHNSIVMQNPHVSGYMAGGRSYELRADRAEQSLENTKVVTLHNISATIGLGGGETARIAAASGVYYSDTQRMFLDQKITLSTTTGIAGSLQSADIDLKAGTMSSDGDIEFSSQGSRIRAKGVDVTDRGQRLVFGNGVHVVYATPPEPHPARSGAANPVTE